MRGVEPFLHSFLSPLRGFHRALQPQQLPVSGFLIETDFSFSKARLIWIVLRTGSGAKNIARITDLIHQSSLWVYEFRFGLYFVGLLGPNKRSIPSHSIPSSGGITSSGKISGWRRIFQDQTPSCPTGRHIGVVFGSIWNSYPTPQHSIFELETHYFKEVNITLKYDELNCNILCPGQSRILNCAFGRGKSHLSWAGRTRLFYEGGPRAARSVAIRSTPLHDEAFCFSWSSPSSLILRPHIMNKRFSKLENA